MGYTQQAVKGVAWAGALKLTTRFLSVTRVLILARLLTPSQYGAFGVASLALSFLDILTETGVNVVLIQEKEKREKYIDSAWIVSIIRGAFISCIIFLSAPYLTFFFRSEESLNLVRFISIVPILRGFINPAVIKFQKELEFHKEYWYRSVVFLVDTIFTISFAFFTRQPVSIVIGMIIGVLFETFFSFYFIKLHPRFRFDKEYFHKILTRGSWVTASGIFNYLFHNADDIFVGRILGTAQLGLYQMGYKISILPITEIADTVSKVTFPVYTRISGDIPRLKKAFLKTLLVVTFLTIPFGILLFSFSQFIVTIALGEKWLGIIPILKILAVFGVLRAISGLTSALFLSVGKQNYISVVTLVSTIGLAVPIVPLIYAFGISGAAFASLIGSITALPLMVYFTFKVLNK